VAALRVEAGVVEAPLGEVAVVEEVFQALEGVLMRSHPG